MPSPTGPEARAPSPGPDAPLRFELTVLPETPLHAWHAQLRNAAGEQANFSSPIELLRHLARLGQPEPPAGGLR